MDRYNAEGKVDPDYESYNSALAITKEEDKKENSRKLKEIIEEQYGKELVQRQEQIEFIELQICKARKLLHLLRYALVTSYYKKKELEFSANTEDASTSDSFAVPSKQNRIHPAVKKLLGTNEQTLGSLQLLNDKRKSTARHSTVLNLHDKSFTQTLSEPEAKRIKLEFDETLSNASSLNELQNLNEKPHISLESMKNRKKTKYRIIVGNISKFMPPSENDNLTHKWMVYVRGPKEKPEVSHFVEKVVFYLHPSYKPHDVVEIGDSPFHLSRRGWGEFPVRVQIFFKVTINKPIDVIHNIKLDKSYTGRQTLGNETLIDVFLYDDPNTELSIDAGDSETFIDLGTVEDNIFIKNEIVEQESEHNYCNENCDIINNSKSESQEVNLEDIFKNCDTLSCDHSYSLPHSHTRLSKQKDDKVIQDESNSLIYGLENYLEPPSNIIRIETNSKRTNATVPFNHINQLFQFNRKDIKFNNTKIIVFGKKLDGLLTNISKLVQIPKNARNLVLFASKNEQDNFKINLPKNKFKNIGEVLPHLFKKLPLTSELATKANYKRLYPFTAATHKEFSSWNIAKQRNAEWSRAKTIRKIINVEKIYGAEKWNTKSILMYGRSHNYTPFPAFGLFNRDSQEKQLLLSCYSNSDPNVEKFTLKNVLKEDNDVTVNVDSDTEVGSTPKKFNSTVDISAPALRTECSFIKQTALDIGVLLKSEEVEEGVMLNGAERMIYEAVKCLANNLIRRAQNYRVCQKMYLRTNDAIEKEDVQVALNERPEMMALLKFRSNRRNMEYFS